MEPIIETRRLSHIYSAGTPFEHTALDGVDFAAYPGEYLGIIGHTGSGKSTLIQHLNGLLKPTSGQVFRHGPELEAMGLGVPAMTRVFHRLRAMGADVDSSVYTVEQAKAAVLAALKRKGDA